jgi:hypothetical protein
LFERGDRGDRAAEYDIPRSGDQSLRWQGESVLDELLTHLAPVVWQNINLTVDYLWDADTRVGPDGFKPLRHAAQPLHAAA